MSENSYALHKLMLEFAADGRLPGWSVTIDDGAGSYQVLCWCNTEESATRILRALRLAERLGDVRDILRQIGPAT